MSLTILQGNCLDVLPTLEAGSVQCVITSPPYWGLRDYQTAVWEGGTITCDHKNHGSAPQGRSHSHSPDQPSRQGMLKPYRVTCGKCGARRIDNQLGMEPTRAEYVANLVQVFREVRRVMRDDAVAFLNLGDCYVDKQLQGVPWKVAFALQDDGWILRSDIIWSKPNCMPESVSSRPTRSHEYLFLLAKSERYYYDQEAVREEAEYGRREWSHTNGNFRRAHNLSNIESKKGLPSATVRGGDPSAGRNRRTVWTVPTQPYKNAHYATFPEKLIEPCILAGSAPMACGARLPSGAVCGAPWKRVVERDTRSRRDEYRAIEPTPKMASGEGVRNDYGTNNTGLGKPGWRKHAPDSVVTLGWQPSCSHDDPTGKSVVLDPFAGSGTTLRVAIKHGRSAIGIELNPAYIEEQIEARTNGVQISMESHL